MRLREMKEILSENLPKLKLDAKAKQNTSSIEIQNCESVIDALFNLERLDFLKEYIQAAKSVQSIFYSRLEVTIVENNIYANFSNIINRITSSSNAVIQAINQAISEQSEFSISVKLPPMNNLNELTQFSKELDTALSQVLINKHFDGKVVLQNFESGSNWLEVIVGSMMALKAVSDLVKYAIDIRIKMFDIEKAKQVARSAKLSGDILETFEKGVEQNIKVLCEAHSKELLSGNGVDSPDPEFITRVSNSIKTLAELFNKGTEIHHALNAPKVIKDEFPDIKMYTSLISDLKRLQLVDGIQQDTGVE